MTEKKTTGSQLLEMALSIQKEQEACRRAAMQKHFENIVSVLSTAASSGKTEVHQILVECLNEDEMISLRKMLEQEDIYIVKYSSSRRRYIHDRGAHGIQYFISVSLTDPEG